MRKAWIFGLGTQKTGNTSLRTALGQLGFRCRQWHKFVRPKGMEYLLRDDPAVIEAGINKVNAWVDYPILFYERLAELCPNAIYVHNVRETGPWLRSQAHQFHQCYFGLRKARRPIMEAYYRKLFGKTWPTPLEAIAAKERTERAVVRWLVGRQHLTVDITREPDWHLKLAEFVGREWPGGPAPRRNVTAREAIDPRLEESPIGPWAPVLLR